MILVYCIKITPRIRHAVSLVLETMLSMDFQLTDDLEAFGAFEGARLHYGDKPLSAQEVFIRSCGLLSEQGIRPLVPEVIRQNGLALLFPSNDSYCDAGFDLFAASFFLTSRYEEYLPAKKDRFGRFEADQSLACAYDFLQVPVVNHYALMLKKIFVKKFPALVFPQARFSYIPTIDVDVAYAFRGRGLARTLYGTLVSLINKDFSSLRKRYRVLAGIEKDPFDTFEEQYHFHESKKLTACYFFLCGKRGPLDRNISPFSKSFRALVKETGSHAIVGVHPSMASHDNPGMLKTEINRLEKILGTRVRNSRQHYLKLSFPETYRELVRNGIESDYSMGYASRPGFRAGICTPFTFYDLAAESPANLRIVPLTVMDGTLMDYMNLSPGEAAALISQLMQEVKKVNGTFVSLWHNDSISDEGRWQGWKSVYAGLLEKAASMLASEV